MFLKFFIASLLSLFITSFSYANDSILQSIIIGDFDKFKTNLNDSNKDYTNSKGESIKDIISNRFISEVEATLSEQIALLDMIDYYDKFISTPNISKTKPIEIEEKTSTAIVEEEKPYSNLISSFKEDNEIILLDFNQNELFSVIKFNSEPASLKSYELPELFDVFVSNMSGSSEVIAKIDSSIINDYNNEEVIDFILSKSSDIKISTFNNALNITNKVIDTKLIYSSNSGSSIFHYFYDKILMKFFGVNIDYIPDFINSKHQYSAYVNYFNDSYDLDYVNEFFGTKISKSEDYFYIVSDLTKLIDLYPDLLFKAEELGDEINSQLALSFSKPGVKSITCKIHYEDFLSAFNHDFDTSYCSELTFNSN